jgi:hypothetical protein
MHPFVALSVASNYAHFVISGVGLQLVIKDTGLADEPETSTGGPHAMAIFPFC